MPEGAAASQVPERVEPGSSANSGVDRAAILLLAIGPAAAGVIMQALEEDEIKKIATAITRLGNVNEEKSGRVVARFVAEMTNAGVVCGNADAAEAFLSQSLPASQVSTIMEEIRGPAGRNMWEKLSNVQEDVLASYLKNEYPQTVAVVLSKVRSEHAAGVLSLLPDDFALDVVERMLRLEPVQREITDKIEQTLRLEFMSNLAQGKQRNNYAVMADIFNNFDRQTEMRFMHQLENSDKELAGTVKSLMFTFDDLERLDASAVQTVLNEIDKQRLVVALKGVNDPLRDLFFSNMSERAAKTMRDDMENTGPVRLKDVDDAQAEIVASVKKLAETGAVDISKKSAEDELVY